MSRTYLPQDFLYRELYDLSWMNAHLPYYVTSKYYDFLDRSRLAKISVHPLKKLLPYV